MRTNGKELTMPRKSTKKNAVPKIKETYVALVLDSSGSMSDVKADAIGGFNQQAKTIRENADKGGTTYVSLFTFGGPPDSLPHEDYLNQPAATLQDLNHTTYTPFGNTPMMDAIGMALTRLQPFDKPGEDVGFLVIVVTDGYENASREWREGSKLVDLIRQLESTGRWTITLIGANVDLNQIARMTGISQTQSYTGTGVGTRQAYNLTATASVGYFNSRSVGATATPDFWKSDKDADKVESA